MLRYFLRPTLEGIHKKVDRREKVRARKAEAAAKIEDAIKKELVERLRQGTYEGIANIPAKAYQVHWLVYSSAASTTHPDFRASSQKFPLLIVFFLSFFAIVRLFCRMKK